MYVNTEIADKYQEFFNFMSQEYGLILTIEQMDEIVFEAQRLVKKFTIPSVTGTLGLTKKDSEVLFNSVMNPNKPNETLQKATFFIMKELFKEIEKWSEKYEFSFQFWGDGNNNVWIEKDGVELFSCGGRESIEEVVKDALKYVYKVNRVKHSMRQSEQLVCDCDKWHNRIEESNNYCISCNKAITS